MPTVRPVGKRPRPGDQATKRPSEAYLRYPTLVSFQSFLASIQLLVLRSFTLSHLTLRGISSFLWNSQSIVLQYPVTPYPFVDRVNLPFAYIHSLANTPI
jgi:hypothetical protein